MIADKGKVGFAKTGSGFGELSLIQNQPRAATVRGAPTRARSGSLSRTHRLTSLSGDGRQVQATSAAVAWSLDRRTFRHYLGSSSTKKMEETMAPAPTPVPTPAAIQMSPDDSPDDSSDDSSDGSLDDDDGRQASL